MNADDTKLRAEHIARSSYGRLIAILAAPDRDIAGAEDALADAFAKALDIWPSQGIPDNPEGWLITTARRGRIDMLRKHGRNDPLDEAHLAAKITPENSIPDERLRLMLVCAHPALDAQIHAPLMLQSVLGLTSHRVAQAFQVAPSTMAQRLVRAKAKIRDAGIPFSLPERDAMPERMTALLEAIYAAYSLDWMMLPDGRDLTREALFLADLVAFLNPDTPEALGLSALLCFLAARHDARLENGILIPLHAQNTALWDHRMISHASKTLTRASGAKQPGRFQLEAAIQSVHAARAVTKRTDWAALVQLYTGLNALYPTLGSRVAQAAALGHAQTPEAGLALLNQLPENRIARYQPYWATRAHLLRDIDPQAAKPAYDKAISLCTEPPLRHWLGVQLGQLKLH